MSCIDSQISEVKNIISNYRQANRRRNRRASRPHREHDRYRACPVYQKLLDSGIDEFTAKQMDRQVHKYKIQNAEKLNVTALLNAIKDKSGAFQEINSTGVGFKPNSTNSSEPGNTGVKDKTYPPSSYGDDYESCMKGFQKLGVSADRAEVECSTQWKGQGYRGGQAKSASVEELELPAWYATTLSAGELMQAQDQLTGNLIKSANTITELPYHVRASLTPAEIHNLESTLPKPNHFRSAADESKHTEYIQSIHEPIYKAQARRNENRLKQANVEHDNTEDTRPAWQVLHFRE